MRSVFDRGAASESAVGNTTDCLDQRVHVGRRAPLRAGVGNGAAQAGRRGNGRVLGQVAGAHYRGLGATMFNTVAFGFTAVLLALGFAGAAQAA